MNLIFMQKNMKFDEIKHETWTRFEIRVTKNMLPIFFWLCPVRHYIFMKSGIHIHEGPSIYGRKFCLGHRVVLEISLVFYRSHHENFESANSERAFKKWCNSHIGNKRMCNARCRSSSCECFDTLRTRVCFSNSDGATRVECSCSSSSAHFRTYQRSHHTNVIVTMWG